VHALFVGVIWRSDVGAKTALLAYADGDIRPALLGATRCERSEAEEAVRRIHPGYEVAAAEDSSLLEDVYPADDITYATVLAGAELFCDRRLVLDRPSKLPKHLLEAAAGRRILMHGMHSMSDWLCFAVWEDGRLVRSLSLSPDGGIRENIGEPYDFEQPYWAGDHPVVPIQGWPDQGPYPLPFHPLELGEDALRALFGFILEGSPAPDDVDASIVHLHGFRVTDPSGKERAERDALLAVARRMGPPRRFQMRPDGTLYEVTGDNERRHQ
jgi:hypothetical protein